MNLNDMQYLQYLITLHQAVASNADDTTPPDGSNTLIQFFEAPYDEITLGSTVISTLSADPNGNIVWASSSVTSGFTWGSGGLYDPFSTITMPYTDKVKLKSSVSVYSTFVANLQWASSTIDTGWVWNRGAVYS